MVDEREFGKLLYEVSQALGRVEQKVDESKEAARDSIRERDAKFHEQGEKLDALSRRQADDAHKVANVQQIMVRQIEVVQSDLKGIASTVGQQEVRLGRLEAPVQKALNSRAARLASWQRLTVILTATGGFAWLFLEPIWRYFADYLMHRFLGP